MSRLPGAATRGRQDSRRSELIEAARRVIQRRGFAKATVGAITGEAGASLGLLNYHFTSRDDVVAEAFAVAAREDLERLEEASLRHEDPPARLAAVLDLYDFDDQPGWQMWIDAWGESVHTEALRTTLEAFQRGWRAVLGNVLADGHREGCWRCPDAEDVAARLVAALDGVGLHTTLHPEDVPFGSAVAWARALIELELGVALPDAPAPQPTGEPGPPYEARIAIRGRDIDATGRVHPAVLLTYLGEAREAWLDERLSVLGAAPTLEVSRVTADFRHPLARRDAEVVVRCALDGIGAASIRTRETIETIDGALVASAAATVVITGADGEPRPLTDDEREALLP
jgi:acyl-CoA thioesterase FadM/DNA-binding transcriptional regulator YbjK